MKTTTNDPIVAEVRAARDKHAAQFGYNIKDIFKNIRDQQKTSGRKYVRYPAATTTTGSTE
jgi:hypothetical protein